MASSIRTFLLINLLLSVTLITSLAIIGNLFLAHRDIQTQLDTQLVRGTLQMQVLFNLNLDQNELSTIQKNLDTVFANENTQQDLPVLRGETLFQILNQDGKILLHSSHAPETQITGNKLGFMDTWIQGQLWRIYSTEDPKSHLIFVMGEQSNFRVYLENQLTQDSIFVMLTTYPFLAILIWVIVGRGLEPLQLIIRAVRNRTPGHLTPLALVTPPPSEIRPLVDEINQLFIRLAEAFDREKRFTGDAAHELRTPLAALKTQVQVALRATNDADRNRALLKAVEGVDRSSHVIQQLLTLSRMVAEDAINEPETLDLNSKAEEVAALLAPEAVKKNIEFELIAATEPALIEANTTSIGILMRNLIDNAVRYTPNDGQVTITIQVTPTECLFLVKDTGPGIPLELRERVFERFFRIAGNQAPGSGLGLGIVKQICIAHHAHIELLTPDNGQGLLVQIRFPRLTTKHPV